MPIARVQMPDGRVGRFEVPEGTTQAEIMAFISQQPNGEQSAYVAQAQKQTPYQNVMAGVGGGMVGLYKGGKQMLGLDDPGEVDEHRRAMEGLRSTKSGTVGEIIGTTAASAPAMLIPGANTVAGSALVGAGVGTLQPTGGEESRMQNVALGAGFGAGGQWAGGKAGDLVNKWLNRTAGPKRIAEGSFDYSKARPASNRLTTAKSSVLRDSKRLGYKTTPAQEAGSRTLAKVEAGLESHPMTAARFDRIKDHNQTITNRIAAKALGQNADEVSDSVLDKFLRKASNVYEMVADNRARAIAGDDFLNRLAPIEEAVDGVTIKALSRDPLVNHFMKLAETGSATGKQLQALSSKLGRKAKSQLTSAAGDENLGMALFEVKDVVDDYLGQGLSGRKAELLAEVREQYRTMKTLLKPGVVETSGGDVSAASLGNALRRVDEKGFAFGRNKTDLYKAAKFAKAFPQFSSSGTAERMMGASDWLYGIPGQGLGYAYNNPLTRGLAAGGGKTFERLLGNAGNISAVGGMQGGLLGGRNSNR